MPTERRLRIELDTDPDLSWLEDRENHQGITIDGEPVSTDDYCDPNNHENFGAILEERCERCEQWHQIDSCWGFDFYIGGNHSAPIAPGDSFDSIEKMPESARWIGESFDWSTV